MAISFVAIARLPLTLLRIPLFSGLFFCFAAHEPQGFKGRRAADDSLLIVGNTIAAAEGGSVLSSLRVSAGAQWDSVFRRHRMANVEDQLVFLVFLFLIEGRPRGY